ncbi:putative ABC-type transport system, permease component [Rubellimicrobium thermophilum DSM 16684]|uniref:Putative ABC-type transport system, permease component n=1 Tax=Rubellimicrobium thermophilum DSM 16684 TaxID=1123069 RepID=S9R5L5_9RHOB|nr:exopolysaccharide biosynthesis protein [Rubellimicrobium thermophilum]EPX87278.1 putative ABC-type transport system, permease component [Rubellimicrobium thermophilum DSM 16684]
MDGDGGIGSKQEGEERRALRLRLRRNRGAEPRKLTAILTDLAHDPARERVSLSDLIEAMDERAFGALLLVFAVPNALPTIPGTTAILGLPLVFLAFQMMIGQHPRLPQAIAKRSIPREDFARLVARINPWIDRADRLTAPRLQFLVAPKVEQAIGAFVMILAILVTLPIPLGNMLPAFAICLIALGVLERDGLWIGIGVAVGLLSLLVAGFVVLALLRAGLLLLTAAF